MSAISSPTAPASGEPSTKRVREKHKAAMVTEHKFRADFKPEGTGSSGADVSILPSP